MEASLEQIEANTPSQLCSGCPVQRATDCTKLSPRSAKVPTSWGIDSVTIERSPRLCINCGMPLAARLVEAEPDHDTHPACDDPRVWLRFQPHRPVMRWNRR